MPEKTLRTVVDNIPPHKPKGKRGMAYFEAVRAALAGNALTLVAQWR